MDYTWRFAAKNLKSVDSKLKSSVKYLQTGDIDAFFSSLQKLLLAEKRILECEIKAIVDTENKRLPLKPVELSQRFQSNSGTTTSANSIYSAFPSRLPATLRTAMNQLPPVLSKTTTAAQRITTSIEELRYRNGHLKKGTGSRL